MLKFQISFKIIKEFVDDAYDQFLKEAELRSSNKD